MNQTPDEAMIMRHLAGQTDEEENQRLEHWRQASPDHESMFQETSRVWHTFTAREPEEALDIDQGWQQLSAQLGLQGGGTAEIISPQNLRRVKPSPVRQQPARRYLWIAAAAAVLLAVMLWQLPRAREQVHLAESGTLTEVSLPDRSQVWLSPGSTLTHLEGFSGEERVARLVGKAYFEVVGEDRPFVILTPSARVRVIGTRFEVWEGNQRTRVVVRSGRVALGTLSGDVEVYLEANQAAECEGGSNPGEPHTVDAEAALSWLAGGMVFQRQRLADVMLDLERQYGKTFQLAAPGLENLTVTASFPTANVEEMLDDLCLTLGLRWEQNGDSYSISK